jgi:hypothetical protein
MSFFVALHVLLLELGVFTLDFLDHLVEITFVIVNIDNWF